MDSPETLIVYTAAVGALVTSVTVPWFAQAPASFGDLLAFAGVGLVGAVAQLFIVQALKRAPASTVSPIGYFELVTAVLFGYAVFGELPIWRRGQVPRSSSAPERGSRSGARVRNFPCFAGLANLRSRGLAGARRGAESRTGRRRHHGEAIAFSLDGREVAAAPGETIWQVAAREGVAIPHLCHSAEPGYRPDGNCRACMVEVEGERVLAASCIRRPAPGMTVRTDTERARHSRRTVFELLLADQPARETAHEHDSRFWGWT